MPIDQLEALLENPAVREALVEVYERSDGGAEDLEWSDVRDALSSRQWGRLIERDVLVSAGTGFALAEPERVRAELEKRGVLDEADAATADVERDALEGANRTPIEPVRWSTVDKAASAFALFLFAGYWSTGLRSVVASVENAVLGPVTDAVPFYAVVLLLAVVTGLYSTALQSRLTDREKLEAYRERLEELRERKQEAEERGDDEALERIREERVEAAGDQLGMLKLQFRPMVWTMLLTVPVFLWLRWKVTGGHLAPDETGLVVPIAGAVSWREPLVGPFSTWIVWYFLASMASRQLIRKAMALRTGAA